MLDLSSFLLDRQKPKRGALYWHYPHYHTEGAKPYGAVRKGAWKLIVNYEDNSQELFNLQRDIGELDNLASQYPDKVRELDRMFSEWKRDIAAQEPLNNPNYDSIKANKWKSWNN